MNIHEYQAKQLLAQFGVPVPPGNVATTPEEAKAAAEKLLIDAHKRVVVKSQIHAGGRGKAMLGQTLVTKQTGPEGRVVSKLLIEAASTIKKEFYLAVLLDRAVSRP